MSQVPQAPAAVPVLGVGPMPTGTAAATAQAADAIVPLTRRMAFAELQDLLKGAQQMAVLVEAIDTLPSNADAVRGAWKYRGGAGKGMRRGGPHGYTTVEFASASLFKRSLLSMLPRKRQVSADLVFQILLSMDKQWIIVRVSSLSGAVSGVNQHVYQLSTGTLVKGLEPRQRGESDSNVQLPFDMRHYGLTSGNAVVIELSRPKEQMQVQKKETDMQLSGKLQLSQGGMEIDPAHWGQHTTEEKAQLAAAGHRVKISEVQSCSCPGGGQGIGLVIGGDPQGLSLLDAPVQGQELQHEVCMAFKLGDTWAKQVVQLEFKARIQLLRIGAESPETAQDFPTLRVKVGLENMPADQVQTFGPAPAQSRWSWRQSCIGSG